MAAQQHSLRSIVVTKDPMLALTCLEDTDRLIFHLLDDQSTIRLSQCNKYLLRTSGEDFWKIKAFALLQGFVISSDYKKLYFEVKRIETQEGRLIYAIQHGHDDMVKLLLSQGVAAATKSYSENQPLSVAAHCGRISTVKILVKAGADIQQWNEDALHEAIKGGSVEMVQFLLDLGAVITYAILHTATLAGKIDILDLLFTRSLQYFPPGLMIEASQANQVTVLDWMTRRGIDIKHYYTEGLVVVASRGYLPVLAWLIARKVDLSRYGPEAFLSAALYDHIAVIELFKTHGLDNRSIVNQAIVKAAEAGQLDVLKHLWTGDDLIPLLVASINPSSSLDVLEYLLEKVRYNDYALNAALNTAVKAGQSIYVEKVIEYINPNVDSVQVAEYSLEITIRHHSVEMLRLLVDHNLLAIDQITDPHLMHAVDTGDADKICFLLNLDTNGSLRVVSEEVARYAMKNATRETINSSIHGLSMPMETY